jgi:hypothetical protein
MSVPTTTVPNDQAKSQAGATATKSAATKNKTGAAADIGQQASREARRLAAAILEVLAGLRTPPQAARDLGLSLPRYYILENRALHGLLAACEARPRGKVRSAASEATALRQDNERLQRELARQQTLVRAAQRTIGLPAPTATPPKPGKKPRRRRPVARALSVAQRLRQQDDLAAAAERATPTATV